MDTKKERNRKYDKKMVELLMRIRYIVETENILGLCGVAVRRINVNGRLRYLFTREERYMLSLYFALNSPYVRRTDGFWWKPGSKLPRLKWIDKQLEKLNNQL